MAGIKPEGERLAEIQPLLDQGLSDEEIAEAMGLGMSHVGYLRRKAGVLRPNPMTRWDEACQELFELLITDGWPASEIAREMGFHVKGLLARDKTGRLRQNGSAAAGVRRWARKHLPDLYEIIYNSRIEEDS